MAAPSPERLLVFSLAGQEFGIPLAPIVEIIRHRPPTPVPGADPVIQGILPFRGRMVTVIDGRLWLGLEARGGDQPSQVIVLRDGAELVGLLVDGAARVTSLSAGEREDLPAALRLARPDRYCGALRRENGYVVLLDLKDVLQEMS
ncbi:MAG TPA: chemotaxis protein CheW [Candidatus Polarisedimenticolia bacterium]|nr:chemotaxis protein CheW [Candidatus Polarisedimenticolia bacterium]